LHENNYVGRTVARKLLFLGAWRRWPEVVKNGRPVKDAQHDQQGVAHAIHRPWRLTPSTAPMIAHPLFGTSSLAKESLNTSDVVASCVSRGGCHRSSVDVVDNRPFWIHGQKH
jgi:hypothetical protein